MGRFNDIVCQDGVNKFLGEAMRNYLRDDTRYVNSNDIWATGIVQETGRANTHALGGAKKASHRFWMPQDFIEAGVPTCGTTPDASTNCAPRGIAQGEETLFKLYENIVYTMDACETQCDNSNVDDPLTVAIDELAGPEMRSQGTHKLMAQLGGLFAHVNALPAGEDKDSLLLDLGTDVLDKFASADIEFMRDGYDFDGMIVHRDVYKRMKKDQLLCEKSTCGEGGYEFAAFENGLVVINGGKAFSQYLNDGAGVYISYLFRTGAFEYGEGVHPMPFERFRDPTANCNDGSEAVYFRREYVLRPLGTDFSTTGITTDYPMRADLLDGTKWEIKAPAEQVPFAFVKSGV